jgi:D-alanine-D-alanine ligase
MQNVLFLFGGKSNEHEISIISASNVYNNFPLDEYQPIPVYIDREGDWYLSGVTIDKIPLSESEVVNLFNIPCTLNRENKKVFIKGKENFSNEINIVYPIVHGWQGEDGVLQGLARSHNLPFAGPSMETAFATFDKDITKILVNREGVNVAPWKIWYFGNEYPNYANLSKELGNTLFIKPSRSGSSVGVSCVKKEEDFVRALEVAGKEDKKVLIESGVNGREIEVAVFVGKDNDLKIANVIGEIKPPTDLFYTYEEKYKEESTTGLVIDTPLSDAERTILIDTVKKVVNGVMLRGTARIDFFLKNDGTFVLNEINTIPGNTSISMYPKLFEASGVQPTELIRMILKNAK